MAGAIKQWDRKVILHKMEATESTDPTPTTAADALQVLNFRPTFMTADGKVRNLEKPWLGANPTLLTAFRRGWSFDMEMHGGGLAAGTTVPPWMKVLRIGGFDAGVAGANSVVQSPVSVIGSATEYAYIDDLLMQNIGCRATVGFTVADDDWPLFNINVMGRPPTALAAQAVPANPTITGYTTPVLASTENTTFTLDGYAVPLRSWTMSNNADLAFRSLIGPLDRIQLRQRPFGGSIVIRVPDLTAKDYFGNIRPGTFMVASMVHGVTAGNIVQIDAPKLQISGDVTIQEESGELMATLPVTAIPNLGNDELIFTSK